jgi:hypothetical protein
MSCDKFEIEIGMRQHGALDAAEEAALDAHVATCESCRKFAASTGAFEATLKRRADEEVERVDWDRLLRGVRELRTNHRLKLWLAPLFLLQVPLIFLIGTGHLPPKEMLYAGPPLTVAIYLAWVWLIHRPFREVMAVVKNNDDLLRGYVRELERRIVRAKIFVAINALFVVSGVVLAIVFGEPIDLGVAAFFLGWVALDVWWRLPRLRRAKAEVLS